MLNVSYHIAIQPKYRQNVVISLRMNDKAPENITQPNFAALNSARKLYSLGRPSRWASALILVATVIGQ